jgi:hypothetical protein
MKKIRILSRVLIPHNFRLEDNIPITFNLNGEKIIIVGQSCEGVKVQSFLSKELDWFNSSKSGLQYYTIKQKLEIGERVTVRKVIANNESENFLEGTIDLLESMFFDIYFEFPEKSFSNNNETLHKIKDKAIHILFYFINAYRSITNEADIYNPSSLDFPAIELYYSKNDYVLDSEILEGKYIFISRELNWKSPDVTGYFKEILDSEKLEIFVSLLNSNKPIPLHLQLLADAREHAIIRKDYKISLILSATATEVYIQDRLIRECELRKIEKLTVGRGKRETTKNYLDAILEGNLREELMGDIFTFLTGLNLKDSTQYQNWYKYSYLLRNDIIHKGKFEVTEEEAKKSFEIVIVFLKYINDLIIKSKK